MIIEFLAGVTVFYISGVLVLGFIAGALYLEDHKKAPGSETERESAVRFILSLVWPFAFLFFAIRLPISAVKTIIQKDGHHEK